MTRKNNFLEGLSSFKFNNLRLALNMDFTFYFRAAKKSESFRDSFQRCYKLQGKKTGREPFCQPNAPSPRPSLLPKTSTSHYLFYSPDYLQERKTFLSTISCIVPNIFYLNNDQLTEILLYGKEDLDNINNTRTLDVTFNYFIETKNVIINCFIETKRSNAQLFWCSPDVMALTLMLHL